MEIEEATERLEDIMDMFERGEEDCIVITRDGNPAALFLPPNSAEA